MSILQTMSQEEVNARDYVQDVYETVVKRNPHESEFHQAIKEILESLIPVIAKHPKYKEHGILERIVEPERLISFRVLG